MNLALQGGMDTFSKAIDAILVTRHRRHIDIEYIPSELEIQVVNQDTCEHDIAVDTAEEGQYAYCQCCNKALTVADFAAED